MNVCSESLARLLDRQPAVVLLTVLRTKGSVPREAGTQMLVGSDETVGTVGGGNLEFQCMALARERLNNASDWMQMTQRFPLGAKLGQCCGGLVEVSLQYIVDPKDAEITASSSAPDFKLFLFGAGHVGRAVISTLANINCEITWIDSREDEFPEDIPAHIQAIVSEDPEDEVSKAPVDSYFLVMTHNHQLDQRICEAILKRKNFRYCGLIGSAIKKRKFEERLLAKGLTEQELERLTCPIGISGISGKEPAVIAVAVVAELLQLSS